MAYCQTLVCFHVAKIWRETKISFHGWGGSFHVAKVSNVEWRTTGLAGAALRNELNVRFILTMQ